MERLAGQTDEIQKKAKKERKTGFCLPTYTLPHPLLQLIDCRIPDEWLMTEGGASVGERERGVRVPCEQLDLNPGCLSSNILYLLAHWTEALVLARGANKPEGSSGSSQCKRVLKKKKKYCWHWTVLVPPSPLSLRVCSVRVHSCVCMWANVKHERVCSCVSVCVCVRGGWVELCCRTAGYPMRAGLFLLCVVRVFSCLYRDVIYLLTTVTRSYEK